MTSHQPARPGTGSRSFRRFVPLVFLLVTGLALPVWPAQPAHAGPTPSPSLDAMPNPVVIPEGESWGDYDLKWLNTGDSSVELWQSVNNGPLSGQTPVSGSSGSWNKIDYGDTVTWWLYTKAGTYLDHVKVTTKRPSTWCEGTCLKAVQVTPHGTFAHFKVVPTNSVVVRVAVYEDNKGKKAFVDGATTAIPVNVAHLDLFHLKPNTVFKYTVTGTDETGNEQQTMGSFKTLRRKVDVNIESIKVVDDSDDFSAGDLTFWFNTNGEWDFVDTYGEVSVSSGDTAHPNHAISIIDAPPTLSLGVYGRDDDCDPTNLCSGGIGPGGKDGGSNSEADWATAWGSANVEVGGPTESFSKSFDFKATKWLLEFKVQATFTVSYV